MSFRLYESAWVVVEGLDKPLQVHRDPINRAAFQVGACQYDVDARPLNPRDAPPILSILSLQAANEAGLRSNYGGHIGDEPARDDR